MNCGKISLNISFNCDMPLVSGTKDACYIYNYDDVEEIVYNPVNPLLIDEIILKSGKTGFKIDGRNNSIMPNFTMIKNTFTDVFNHTVNVKGFDISPEQKDNLQKMISGHYIVVVQNNFKGVDNKCAFEVYGSDSGLLMSSLTRDPNNQDTQGSFDITFSNVKNNEPKMPRYFLDTDYQTTLDWLNNSLILAGDFNNDFNNDFS